jgi:hypothetical protein
MPPGSMGRPKRPLPDLCLVRSLANILRVEADTHTKGGNGVRRVREDAARGGD